MKEEGQIVLFEFPRGDLKGGKLRPALLLNKLPGPYEVWLICMISTQLQQKIKGFDEIVSEEDDGFKKSGLREASLIRLGRLAAVDANILEGAISTIKTKLTDWLIDK